MPNRALEVKIWGSSAHPKWKLVLHGMVSFMTSDSDETFYAEPGKLAARVGYSKRQLQRYLDELESCGILVRCGGGNWRGRVVWRIAVDRLAQGDNGVTLRRVTKSACRVTFSSCRVTKSEAFSPPTPPYKPIINTNKTNRARDAHACSLSGSQKPDPWEPIKAELRTAINPHSFSTWFGPTKYLHVEDRTLCVGVPTSEFAEFILGRFRAELTTAISAHDFDDVKFFSLSEKGRAA